VRLEFELNDARADLLGEGIDVAIRAGKEIEPTLIARQVGQSRAALVASPAYLAARGRPGSAQDLSRHDCITQPARTGAPIVWRLDGPGGQTEQAVNGRFQANTAQAQLGAAVAGLGIALLPTLMVASHLQAGILQEVLPGHGVDGIGVYLVHLSRRQLPRAVRVFTEFVVKTMLELGMVRPASPPK
jgi:LysR family transcriptional regulator AphB